MLRERGGVWISAKEPEHQLEVILEGPDLGYQNKSVQITRSDQQGFYLGVSNALLWPLLHSLPPTIRMAEAPWRNYVGANRAFADAVLESSKPRDLVWVQDYHLMLVPGMLRKRRSKARIGWFCHVPWPNPDLFSILPWREEILEGLLGADVLGFHTEVYARNFLECVERLTEHGVDHARRSVRRHHRSTKVISAPIGVPVQELTDLASNPQVAEEAERLKERVGGRRIVLGVDRLDYTKGIPERILGYEQFLKRERRTRDKYVFVQVMVPSRTDVQAYADLKAEIDRMIGSVNGRYGSTGSVPIHYLYRNLDQRTLFAHYQAAEVAMVTPLRDGMNLVALEYVISKLDTDGVLVLSEFAGAAEYLKDAILVNPYDIHAMAESLHDAFHMSTRARKRSMRSMREEVARLDVHHWADEYLRTLEQET